MSWWFDQISEIIRDYPASMAVVSNLVLGCILLCAIWIPQKFVSRDLNKVRKGVPLGRFDAPVFDKISVVFSGVLWAFMISVGGGLFLSAFILCPGADRLLSIVIIFSVVTVFVKLLVDSRLANKASLPSHYVLYRISAVSFLAAAIFSVLSVRFPHYIVHGFSLLILVYYFIELCSERHTLEKRLAISKAKEESWTVPFVEFINKRFVLISLVGMAAVILMHHRCGTPMDSMLYKNILGMFCVLVGVFLLQGLMTAVINRFLARLDDFGKSKTSKKSANLRKRNWMFVCDTLVTIGYALVVLTALWLLGVDVLKYMVFDTTVAVGLVVFGTILLYIAFGEFADAYVDRANSVDRDKILTFMPIVRVIFNVLLFFLAGLSILSQLGVAIGPFLASFAAVGAAVALAAKNLVEGFLYGIILLIENNFYIGDFITINGQSGIVVKISTRTLTLRDFNGDEYSIPYNTISVVINHSRDFFMHFESLLVSPHADVKKAGELLTQVVNQLKSETQYADKILGDVNITGIKTFSDEGLRICWSLKTSTAGRLLHLEIYRRLLPLLRDAGIPIPYKQEYTEHLLTADS